MRGISILFLTVILSACSSVKNTVVREDNVQEVMETLGKSDALTEEEFALVGLYALRAEMGGKFGVDTKDMYPATVKEIIERQRAFIAAKEEEERIAQEQRELAEKKKREQAATIRATVPAMITEISFIESNFRQKRYSDELRFAIEIKNSGAKQISGVQGSFVFRDSFGDSVAKLSFKSEMDIPPGREYHGVLSKDYNQFIESDKALRSFDLSRGTVVWEPSHIVFADGTSIKLD